MGKKGFIKRFKKSHIIDNYLYPFKQNQLTYSNDDFLKIREKGELQIMNENNCELFIEENEENHSDDFDQFVPTSYSLNNFRDVSDDNPVDSDGKSMFIKTVDDLRTFERLTSPIGRRYSNTAGLLFSTKYFENKNDMSRPRVVFNTPPQSRKGILKNRNNNIDCSIMRNYEMNKLQIDDTECCSYQEKPTNWSNDRNEQNENMIVNSTFNFNKRFLPSPNSYLTEREEKNRSSPQQIQQLVEPRSRSVDINQKDENVPRRNHKNMIDFEDITYNQNNEIDGISPAWMLPSWSWRWRRRLQLTMFPHKTNGKNINRLPSKSFENKSLESVSNYGRNSSSVKLFSAPKIHKQKLIDIPSVNYNQTKRVVESSRSRPLTRNMNEQNHSVYGSVWKTFCSISPRRDRSSSSNRPYSSRNVRLESKLEETDNDNQSHHHYSREEMPLHSKSYDCLRQMNGEDKYASHVSQVVEYPKQLNDSWSNDNSFLKGNSMESNEAHEPQNIRIDKYISPNKEEQSPILIKSLSQQSEISNEENESLGILSELSMESIDKNQLIDIETNFQQIPKDNGTKSPSTSGTASCLTNQSETNSPCYRSTSTVISPKDLEEIPTELNLEISHSATKTIVENKSRDLTPEDLLEEKIIVSNGDRSDIEIEIDNEIFHLHKKPLKEFSRLFQQEIDITEEAVRKTEKNDGMENDMKEVVRIQKFPGGAKIFSIIADYFYMLPIKLKNEQLIPLYSAVLYLEIPAAKCLVLDQFSRSITKPRKFDELIYSKITNDILVDDVMDLEGSTLILKLTHQLNQYLIESIDNGSPCQLLALIVQSQDWRNEEWTKMSGLVNRIISLLPASWQSALEQHENQLLLLDACSIEPYNMHRNNIGEEDKQETENRLSQLNVIPAFFRLLISEEEQRFLQSLSPKHFIIILETFLKTFPFDVKKPLEVLGANEDHTEKDIYVDKLNYYNLFKNGNETELLIVLLLIIYLQRLDKVLKFDFDQVDAIERFERNNENKGQMTNDVIPLYFDGDDGFREKEFIDDIFKLFSSELLAEQDALTMGSLLLIRRLPIDWLLKLVQFSDVLNCERKNFILNILIHSIAYQSFLNIQQQTLNVPNCQSIDLKTILDISDLFMILSCIENVENESHLPLFRRAILKDPSLLNRLQLNYAPTSNFRQKYRLIVSHYIREITEQEHIPIEQFEHLLKHTQSPLSEKKPPKSEYKLFGWKHDALLLGINRYLNKNHYRLTSIQRDNLLKQVDFQRVSHTTLSNLVEPHSDSNTNSLISKTTSLQSCQTDRTQCSRSPYSDYTISSQQSSNIPFSMLLQGALAECKRLEKQLEEATTVSRTNSELARSVSSRSNLSSGYRIGDSSSTKSKCYVPLTNSVIGESSAAINEEDRKKIDEIISSTEIPIVDCYSLKSKYGIN
ncbi:hypothetical protein SNEBB_001175 [Seison nebaliae]|nr:hypothetical protein SNEBB_001175 [Seison nebaliae]